MIFELFVSAILILIAYGIGKIMDRQKTMSENQIKIFDALKTIEKRVRDGN